MGVQMTKIAPKTLAFLEEQGVTVVRDLPFGINF